MTVFEDLRRQGHRAAKLKRMGAFSVLLPLLCSQRLWFAACKGVHGDFFRGERVVVIVTVKVIVGVIVAVTDIVIVQIIFNVIVIITAVVIVLLIILLKTFWRSFAQMLDTF